MYLTLVPTLFHANHIYCFIAYYFIAENGNMYLLSFLF